MVDAWTRFARDGDPGWPRFTPDDPYVQSLAPGAIERVDLATEHHCAVWQRAGR
jgi:para-nitrobenzyl esterase